MKNQEGTIHWGNFLLHFSGISDKGPVRKENEDDFLIMENYRLFCIADGMGGEVDGKLAGRTTLDSVAKSMHYLNENGEVTMPYGLTEDMLTGSLLENVTRFANFQVNKKSAGRKMGSTLVAAHFSKLGLDVVHVGDSRLYLWRAGQLTQLTEDHSLVYELFKSGRITQKEMRNHHMHNVITRAIGISASVEPTLDHVDVFAGDIFLLCTDGLTNMLNAGAIIETFEKEPGISSLAHSLIRQANNAGGKDNVTVLLIAVSALS